MIKNREFEVRVYQNKANYQYSLIPIKKNLSKNVLDLFSDEDVVGFKLKVIKVLEVMPKPKRVVNDWNNSKEVNAHKYKLYMERLKEKKGKA